jgi:hypothetical protein
MQGRKKMQNSKSEVIRISKRARIGLSEIKKKMQMPSYYTENEIIEALVQVI